MFLYEFSQPRFINRVCPDFQEGNTGRQKFLHVRGTNTACNNCSFPAIPEPVISTVYEQFPDGGLFFVEFFMENPGMGRDYDILPRIFMELTLS